MKRRAFILALGGTVVGWPLAAHAQRAARNRKVGFLHPGQSAAVSKWIAAIHEGLNGADSQSDARIELVIRLADGDLSRLSALATDLVNNGVDAILAAAPPGVQAAAGATKGISRDRARS
jgi:putative ABC transport system substrate-binding protein